MTYINPKWFYWLEVVDNINVIIAVLFIASLVGFTFLLPMVLYSVYNPSEWEESELKIIKRMFTVFAVSLSMLSLLLTFIPSKQTLIEMKIAENVTHENVNIATESIKNTVDYIFEKLGGN